MSYTRSYGRTEVKFLWCTFEEFIELLNDLYKLLEDDVVAELKSNLANTEELLKTEKEHLSNYPESEYSAQRVIELEEKIASIHELLDSQPIIRVSITAKDGITENLDVKLKDFETIRDRLVSAKYTHLSLPRATNSPDFSVTVSKDMGISVSYSASDAKTVRNFVAIIKNLLIKYRPRWYWIKSLPVFGALGGLIGLGLSKMLLSEAKSESLTYGAIGIVAALFLIATAFIPRVKFIGQKRDWTLTGKSLLKWLAGVLASGIVGVIITRFLS